MAIGMAHGHCDTAVEEKQPKSNKGNWRGVTLLSVGVKILARIVANRPQAFSETLMDEEQVGFRRNRGVDDVLQVSRRITKEICFAQEGEQVTLAQYDIEKAYPRVNRYALSHYMDTDGTPRSPPRFYQRLSRTSRSEQLSGPHIRRSISPLHRRSRAQRRMSIVAASLQPISPGSAAGLPTATQTQGGTSRPGTGHQMEVQNR